MTDELSFEAEIPIFQSNGWRSLYEVDFELRQTAYLLGVIVDSYKLETVQLDQPLIQRLVTVDGVVFRGIRLGELYAKRESPLNVALALHSNQPTKNVRGFKIKQGIRNLPVVGVAPKAESDSDIDYFDLCSLYKSTVMYNIPSRKIVDASMEAFKNISLLISYEKNIFHATELGLFSDFLKTRKLARGPWKSKYNQ